MVLYNMLAGPLPGMVTFWGPDMWGEEGLRRLLDTMKAKVSPNIYKYPAPVGVFAAPAVVNRDDAEQWVIDKINMQKRELADKWLVNKINRDLSHVSQDMVRRAHHHTLASHPMRFTTHG